MTVEIYSTDTDAGALSVIERRGADDYERVDVIQVGNAPRGSVKFTRDGRGYVSNTGGDTISEIDVGTHQEAARIQVGIAPRGIGIVPGDLYALVSNSGSNSVSIVDLDARREVGRVDVGRDPRHMAVTKNGRSAYVAIWGAGHVVKLDISSLAEGGDGDPSRVREIAQIPVGEKAYPYSVALRPGEKELYVANTQARYISIIDTEKDEVIDQVDLPTKGARAVAFSPKGEAAYVSVEDSSLVAVIDTSEKSVKATLPVGPGPRGIAIFGETLFSSAFARQSPTAESRAIMDFSPNSITMIHLGELREDQPDMQAYSEVVVGEGPCSVSVIDTAQIG